MNRIVSAKDYARREGAKSVRELVKRWSGRMYQRGQLDTPFVDGPLAGEPVFAKINHGQWIAHCDQCGTPMWVDADEPLFYCYGCGNRVTGGKPRPVIFPSKQEQDAIERLLLERPVDDRKGTNDIDRAFHALPMAIGIADGELVALDRTWEPHESVKDLQAQNALIEPLMKEREKLNLHPDSKAAREAYQEVLGHFAAKSKRKPKEEDETHMDLGGVLIDTKPPKDEKKNGGKP
jgi:hypothetical protein